MWRSPFRKKSWALSSHKKRTAGIRLAIGSTVLVLAVFQISLGAEDPPIENKAQQVDYDCLLNSPNEVKTRWQLGFTQFDDADVKLLAPARKLKDLLLSGTQVTDAGLKELQAQAHPELETLDIAGAKITDAGAESIGRIKTLRLLVINGISDAGLKHLLPLKDLTELYIQNPNQVTDSGIAYLSHFQSLQIVRLNCKNVSDAGLAYMKGLRCLATIEIRSDHVNLSGLKDFAAKRTGLQDLLVCGHGVDDEGLKNLSGFDGISTLGICSDRITDEGLKALEGMSIYHLAIGGAKITDAGLERIVRIKTLCGLDLSKNAITTAGLRTLKEIPERKPTTGLPNFTKLAVSNVTDEGLKIISELPHLTNIAIYAPHCTDVGLSYLKNLKELRDLAISAGVTQAESVKYTDHVSKILPDLNIFDPTLSEKTAAPDDE